VSCVATFKDKDGAESAAFQELGIKAISEKVGGIRVRQHVNPLKRELQILAEAPNWDEAFADPSKPLHVDLGCGPGRFLLLKARREPESNYLGMEIRKKLVDRGALWAREVGVDSSVKFMTANATISLSNVLADYPGTVHRVSIQFPDPHFKKRHHKRRIVQPHLVRDVAACLKKGAQVFLQSDVLDVAEAMRDDFEQHGREQFRVCEEVHGPKGSMPVQDAWDSESEDNFVGEWSAYQWLETNPMNVPTEREVYVLNDHLPVYRMLLERI